MVELTEAEIDTARMLAEASRDDCGATVLFLGSTRRWTGEKETEYLEYQAYQEMAVPLMQQLESEAMQRWPIRYAAIVHRIGRVEVQQASVAVVVSSPHRKAAFAAGQWLIDEVKRQVPIWKQEHWANRRPEWVHETHSTALNEMPSNDKT